MSTYDSTDRGAYVALGAIFGIAAGIGAGMLMAPRSGEETRRHLRAKAADAKSRAQSQLNTRRDQAVQKLSTTLDKSKDMVNQAADKTKEAADKAATRATTAADQAKAQAARTGSTTSAGGRTSRAA